MIQTQSQMIAPLQQLLKFSGTSELIQEPLRTWKVSKHLVDLLLFLCWFLILAELGSFLTVLTATLQVLGRFPVLGQSGKPIIGLVHSWYVLEPDSRNGDLFIFFFLGYLPRTYRIHTWLVFVLTGVYLLVVLTWYILGLYWPILCIVTL